ncbi:helicase, ATP-dependent [Xenorhabdus nematophila ATCC 19061]|uniref:Helicase, ATP-dependent n=1 Tax=Xenorhabdus nematophila (strain ATCC 19061 / DSM 3370 / CCUG 14189 / LMG 1036 / NCIMB 9965 / AN6) TaxID=406817 RepID=D3VL05_XENNA|nr:ATP-dependent helicase HrpB [Xenorhabdus nematophila]CBJ88964.1 helicase, ATP-dependent [Xenorhabdus nematophila ATCC 19061]CEE93196.1 helicase, ATP-dependent [Xenorhabdus nematophila str. Anatoliense]CEE93781.1 helicase, ATP-dependent [Xenorhabdus nematophila str. Anatoliense]CEK21873.1 helicase, ATP-dependent [Xenorhabdus nematophila AN6/1]
MLLPTYDLLPIYDVAGSVIDKLQTSKQVLLHAPTGAGKSTGLPLAILHQAQLPGRIIMLEPRRIAARSVAERLAEQLNEPVGMTVGYRMRSDTKVSASTRLEVVTEGILTRMLQQDPELGDVSLVILDEFHERSLQADLALALLLDVQEGLREDLRILVMSATLDNQRLAALLPDAPVIVSEGRSYPVTRSYHPLPTYQPFEPSVASAVLRLLQQETGSLLLFLPGVGEIQRVLSQLESQVNDDTLLCPLYGALSLSDQRKAITPAPKGMRKVVLATNIAETSLTIEGIRLVVDCGLERTSRFEPRSGLTRLVTQRISQASMIQRAGRAGRLESGVCWHLFSQEQAERAAEQGEPEILHSDLSSLLLSLLQWGCRDSTQLHWLDNPPKPALVVAESLLLRLGALDEKQQLTARGWQMTESGCEPRLAAMLCVAKAQGNAVLATAAKLVAILEEPPRHGQPDLIYWMTSNQRHWRQRADQLIRNIANKGEKPRLEGRDEKINLRLVPELLVQGFPDRIAKNRDNLGRFQLANGLGVALEREEPLSGETWLVVPSLQQGSKSPDARVLLACPLNIEQTIQQYPHLFTEYTAVEWDDSKGSLRAWRRLQCGRLVVKVQPLAKPSEAELQEALLNWVRQEGLSALNWSVEASQLRTRLQRATEWLPEIEWPAVDDTALLNSLEQWLLPALGDVTDLKGLRQVDLSTCLMGLLDWQQRQILDNELPANYTVPTGSRITIQYFSDKPPVLSVRMQEMYGEQQNPVLAKGRLPVVIELLSPAHRPLQITQDLAAFWRGAYREVQKEMKGRYPKHLWPDDPANTAPTRRVKKYM